MKLILILVSAAVCLAEPPRPSARLILLPRVESQPSAAQVVAKSQESQSAKVLESGEYYVLTPEGKLQMVKYTTAALKQQPQPAQAAQAAQAAQKPEPFAQFQVGYLQYPGFQYQSEAPSQTKADYKKKPKDAADFEARVEYRDVKPIPAPIYAYNPEPLVRILKK